MNLRSSRARAFSLIELMAALAVLALMLVMLSQISNSTMSATSVSMKQIEATRQARSVQDMLTDDLSSIVTANDASTFFVKEAGTDSQLVFISRRRGPSGATPSRFVAVRYALQETTLVRTVTPVAWDQFDLSGAAFSTNSDTTTGELAEGIIRFALVVQLDNGSVVNIGDGGTWIDTNWNGSPVPEGFSALKLSTSIPNPAEPRVRSVWISLAAVEKNSLHLPNAENIASKLPSPASGETPQAAWSGAVDQGLLREFPSPAVGSLCILQKNFRLP